MVQLGLLPQGPSQAIIPVLARESSISQFTHMVIGRILHGLLD